MAVDCSALVLGPWAWRGRGRGIMSNSGGVECAMTAKIAARRELPLLKHPSAGLLLERWLGAGRFDHLLVIVSERVRVLHAHLRQHVR